MTARFTPFGIAVAVSVLVVWAAALEPYFAGDVAVARALQAVVPAGGWAPAMTNLALAPGKYIVMAAALGLAWWLSGWKGAAITAVAIALEQWGGEASKQLAQRPRPSRELIAVSGNPSGFSFPSTFTTFITVTFGSVLLFALHARTPLARPVAVVCGLVIVLGWSARVALGAHWPSDVVLSTMVCLAWIWAARRVALPAS